MPLETVFLDAGGVLMHPNWWRVSDILASHGVSVPAEALMAADPPARRELDDLQTIGSTTDASRGWLFFDLVLAHAGTPRSEATGAALTELHRYHTTSNLWEYVPDGVVPALEALRARGLQLIVVSNANGTLRAHCDRLGLTDRFDLVLDSADEGVEKPDPRFFEIALARGGARRNTTIHVGDLYYVDVIGARSAGLRGVLVDEADLRQDADCPRVRSLGELVTRIGDGEFD
ncbi:MAG: HAD-IA family hydrolase [Acidobacteria bacterium]|nr:HAD-IA family hydrolase [Acidobacteriota bacterium]MBA3886103.1 HAD-IA family hydrolase [Acidobacteriota bacterium]